MTLKRPLNSYSNVTPNQNPKKMNTTGSQPTKPMEVDEEEVDMVEDIVGETEEEDVDVAVVEGGVSNKEEVVSEVEAVVEDKEMMVTVTEESQASNCDTISHPNSMP